MFCHRAIRKAPLTLALVSLLLSACSKDPESLTQSAREHLERRDPTSAILDLKTALQSRPDDAEARLLLGRALFATGDPSGAQVELERAQSLGLGFDRVAASLGEVWLALGRGAQVVDKLSAVQAADPRDLAEVKRVLALGHLRQGEQDQAQSALDAALQAVPDHRPARILALRLQAARGQGEAALQATGALLKQHADDP
ncbi:MAG: tetratricopeptide repeat protein [Rubrivivax sp.]|nr:tetratricopeptide repeat protein [Rubrivivax sp.]